MSDTFSATDLKFNRNSVFETSANVTEKKEFPTKKSSLPGTVFIDIITVIQKSMCDYFCGLAGNIQIWTIFFQTRNQDRWFIKISFSDLLMYYEHSYK